MTADPRAVEIIAAELARHTLGLGNKCACGRTVAEDDLALPEWDQHLASASAAALTAAGWSLLPPGGQTRDPREIVARTQWALDHEDATPDDWDEYADQETRELYLRDADSVLAALRDAGLLAEPGTNWHVVVKTVPGRDPELMAEIVNGADELRAWLADLRNDPDRDRLAAFTGYRLTPVTEEAR